MILIVALLAYFCLVGLTARRFRVPTQWLVFTGVVAMLVISLATRSLP